MAQKKCEHYRNPFYGAEETARVFEFAQDQQQLVSRLGIAVLVFLFVSSRYLFISYFFYVAYGFFSFLF